MTRPRTATISRDMAPVAACERLISFLRDKSCRQSFRQVMEDLQAVTKGVREQMEEVTRNG